MSRAGRMRRATSLAVTAVALLLAVVMTAPTRAAAAHSEGASPSPPVALLLVPDLRWTDLAWMPRLRQLAAGAAVGQLSVRAQGASTRCGDGLLELSAGTRVPSGVRGCRIDTAELARLRASYRHNRYGAQVGLLGDAIGSHRAAADPAAAAVVVGRVGAPPPATTIRSAFARDPSAVVAAVDDALYVGNDRRRDAASLDQQLAAQLAQVPPHAVVLVVGSSDAATGGPHLHPLFVSGPGWPHRALSSASTGRAPYVQLFDVTATVLALEHAVLPTSVSGRAVHPTRTAVRAASAYADADRHARRALAVGHPTFTVLCAVLIGCLLLLAAGRREAVWPARLLVLAPLTTWLVQLVPWWRWSTWAYALVVAGGALVGAAAVTLAARRSTTLALVLVPAVTAAVLIADQLAGAPLQLSAPFGDNPLVAGRFHGMGNIDFGVAMTSLLLSAAVFAFTTRRRAAALPVTAALCALAVVVDGAPPLGDDLGGVLALVPAAAVLLALVLGVRVSARRVVAVVAAAVVVAGVAAVIDYQRPVDRQTHAGRFVGQVLHGGAWRVVHRKLDAVLASFDNPVVTALVLAAVAVMLLSRGGRTWPPAVRAAAAATAVIAVVGSLVNDSGVFVAAAALLAFAPAVVAAEPAVSGRRDNRML